MTTNDSFDNLLTSWLLATASEQEPSGFHAGVMAVAGRTRQRRRWIGALDIGLPVTDPWARASRWRTAVLLVALAALLALAAAVVAGALRVAPQARNGLIAYSVAGEVHLIEPDGSNDRVIGEGGCPTFSEDGRVLARWTSGTVTLTSPQGNDPYTLTGIWDNGRDPRIALSPDGTQLAWFLPVNGNYKEVELWVSPVSGGPGRRLVPAMFAPGVMYAMPSWSPDGRFIAFEGLSQPLQQYDRSAIYLVDASGGEPRVLTTRPGDGSLASIPAWSPDGRSLAYAGAPDLTPSNDVGMDLFVLDVDSDVERKVTQSPGNEGIPRWSPDGRRLAYLQETATLAMLDTGAWQPVGPVDATAMDGFSWSPDGTRILAYSDPATQQGANPVGTSEQDANATIRTIPLDGSPPWSVAVPGAVLGSWSCEPSWQAVLGDQPASGSPTDAPAAR